MNDTKRSDSTRRWMLLGLAAVVLILGCWLSSGTLTPYGTRAYGPCQYRVNIDHPHFVAVYRMLEGRPAEEWKDSVVLRRILHPLLAYPWMKAFGYDLGGLLFNIFLHFVALIGLALAIRRYFGARAATLVSWLFATYPGYAYWVGLPYSYAFIVPASVMCVIAMLWWHDRPSALRTSVVACVVGLAGLGYDLMPFFGGGLLLLVIHRRRWRDVPLALVILGAWAVFSSRGIPAIFGFSPSNSNTQAYGAIIDSYLDAGNRVTGWGGLVADVPGIFVSNFVFSNFVFFPILMLWVVGLHLRWRLRPVLHPVAGAVLLATLGVFLFLNLAPPYDSIWQLRGTWIPRLFQPWFVAVLVVVAALAKALQDPRRRRLLVWSVAVVVALDAAVIAGPFIGLTYFHAGINQHFYRMHGHHRNAAWLRELGRRPYGVCR